MSEKKRKPKVIHVDKLVIKADNVILENEEKGRKKSENHSDKNRDRDRDNDRDEVERDPWGFPIRPMPNRNDRGEDDNSEDQDKGGEDENHEDRRGSWF